MEHVKDIELIELTAERLDAGRKADVLDHLRQCAQCREKMDGIRRTWDILGAWEVDIADRNGPTSIEQPSNPRVEGGQRPAVRLFTLGWAVRAAAAVAVTVLGGYMGGRWSVRQGTVPAEVEPPQYLSALGLDVGDSLSALVLDDDEPLATEEGRT
jgi:hypothetical protein